MSDPIGPDTFRSIGPEVVVEGPLNALSNAIRLSLGLIWVGLASGGFLIALIACLPSRATRIKIGNIYGTVAGRGASWLTGSRYEIRGEQHADRHRPSLYLCNHASILDTFVGIWMSRVGTCGVAKKEIIYYPFFGQFFWLSGHLTLDRSNNKTAVRALERLVGFVARHKLSVYIWPEGTRSRDGRLLPFKRGAFHLALATKLPIVPIVLTGTQRAWPHRSLRLFRTTVRVQFLPPISTAHWTKETLDEHIEEIRQVYLKHLPEDQRPLELAAAAAA
ncbi:MAG: lysophospholipid acyltransferase family protein [Myxococcota bacterium]